MPDNRRQIFISYANQDAIFAERLVKALGNELQQRLMNYTVWTDRNIMGNEVFSDAIEREINKASIVIVIVSPNYLNSQWCNYELGLAMGDKKPILPVIISSVSHSKMPSYLRDVVGLQVDDLAVDKDFYKSIVMLADALESMEKDLTG